MAAMSTIAGGTVSLGNAGRMEASAPPACRVNGKLTYQRKGFRCAFSSPAAPSPTQGVDPDGRHTRSPLAADVTVTLPAARKWAVRRSRPQPAMIVGRWAARHHVGRRLWAHPSCQRQAASPRAPSLRPPNITLTLPPHLISFPAVLIGWRRPLRAVLATRFDLPMQTTVVLPKGTQTVLGTSASVALTSFFAGGVSPGGAERFFRTRQEQFYRSRSGGAHLGRPFYR